MWLLENTEPDPAEPADVEPEEAEAGLQLPEPVAAVQDTAPKVTPIRPLASAGVRIDYFRDNPQEDTELSLYYVCDACSKARVPSVN